jgi:hypothetical protein
MIAVVSSMGKIGLGYSPYAKKFFWVALLRVVPTSEQKRSDEMAGPFGLAGIFTGRANCMVRTLFLADFDHSQLQPVYSGII